MTSKLRQLWEGRQPSVWLLFAGVLALQLFLLHPLYAHLYPDQDELALIAYSTSINPHLNPWDWLTQGFSAYFTPFAEWDAPGTNFMRPLVNAVYWLWHALFGDAWGSQMVLTFAAHAAALAALLWLVRRLGLPAWAQVPVLLLAVVSPAYVARSDGSTIHWALTYPAYAPELWCALLSVLAMVQLAQHRILGFSVATTLALLTKETALTVPLAALCFTGLWWSGETPRRRVRNAVLILLPMLLWLALRLLVYQPAVSGNFALHAPGGESLLYRFAKSAFNWPTELFTGTLLRPVGELRQHELGEAGLDLLGIALNLGFWCVMATATYLQVLRVVRERRSWSELSREWSVIAALFALGNLALMLTMGAREARWAYLWFLIGPAAIVALLERTPRLRAVFCGLLMVVVLANAVEAANVLSPAEIQRYQAGKDADRSLINALRHPPPGTHTIYVANDPVTGFATGEALQIFAGIPQKVIRINSLGEGCVSSPASGETAAVSLERRGGEVVFRTRIPDCDHPSFESALGQIPIPLDGDGLHAERAGLTYYFPNLEHHAGGLVRHADVIDFGDEMEVRGPAATDAAWLAYDAATNRFEWLTLPRLPSCALVFKGEACPAGAPPPGA